MSADSAASCGTSDRGRCPLCFAKQRETGPRRMFAEALRKTRLRRTENHHGAMALQGGACAIVRVLRRTSARKTVNWTVNATSLAPSAPTEIHHVQISMLNDIAM